MPLRAQAAALHTASTGTPFEDREHTQSADSLVAPLLDAIENEVYTDLFLRPGMETRVKTPTGWLPVSALAKGTRPAAPQREWLSRFVAQMSGVPDWHEKMQASRASFSFMFPFDPRELRLRCKVALCSDVDGGVSGANSFTVNLRNLPRKIPPLMALGLPNSVTQLLPSSGGLVIVTGQICSGKTTTLASLVNHLNETRASNIVALEQLNEYVHTPARSIVTQRTVPDTVPSFLQGIHDALDGQAVDVMMIGEVVDRTTMDAMLRAAESGHLVLATMHARNAVGAVSRVIDMFPPDERPARLALLAEKLVGVVAQKLMPHRDQSRYVLGYEVLRNSTPAVAEAIREGNLPALHTQMEQGAAQGMVTLNQTLRKLVHEQRLERNVALDATYARSELEQLLRS
jgi:twitching motility protein PilT